jgi:hypothetical protein
MTPLEQPTYEERRQLAAAKREAEQTARRARFAHLLTVLAAALDGHCTAPLAWTRDGDTFTLDNTVSAYARLHLALDEWKGRVSIHATVPFALNAHRPSRYQWNGDGIEPTLTITVSVEKTARQIAADIYRRLLPQAQELMARTRLNEAQHAQAKADTAAIAARIHAAAPCFTPEGHQANVATEAALRAYSDKWYGTARVSTYEGGTVSFDLRNVPVEAAVQIAAVLQNHHGRKA